MTSLSERVAGTAERYGMFTAGQRVGVAVSGGADSVCLLHVLMELAPRWGLRLTVLHLDHGLRGAESRGDADFVTNLAGSLGLPVVVRRVNLSAAAGNLEENARDARLAFFHGQIGEGTVERVALGHTQRDQAETVLFRFLRGAGTAGLAGIRPVTADGIVRPLIEIGREDVEGYLRGRGLGWREDSTNSSPRFARNRIRHELLPLLEREWNPQIEETLAHTAEWASGEEEYWEGEVERIWRATGQTCPAPTLRASGIRELPEAVARRVVRRAIGMAKGDLRGIDFAHVEAVLRLARGGAGTGGFQAHGVDVRRSFDWIRLVPQGISAPVPYRLRVVPPATVELPGADRFICLELIEKPETTALSDYVYNGEMGCLDWGRVSGSLELRNWMPGDRLQPLGTTGPKKIKTLFQLARIPSWERTAWPVLADGASVVWTRRFGVAAPAAASPASKVVLRIREIRALEPLNSESGSGGPASI